MGMEPAAMLDTIKAQCFKGNPQNISDAQLAAFVSIAAEMGVNPLLPGMLYAFPIQGGGIVPMMGPDGVYKKLTEHPDVDSWETEVFPADVSLPPTHATTKIWRKGRERPLSYTALLSEWKVGSNPNWNTRTRHMLGLRSLKQAARQIIHGIPFDEDERVMMNVTDTVATEVSPQNTTPDRPAPRARATRGAAAAKAAEVVVEQETVDAPKSDEKAPATPIEAVAQDNAKLESDLKTREAKLTESEKPAETPVTRAFLKDGEKMEAIVTVSSVDAQVRAVKGVPTCCVSAQVAGAFTGEVRDIKSGTVGKSGEAIASPLWSKGATLKVSLEGRISKAATGPTVGKVIVWTEKLEAAPQQAAEMDE